MCGALLYVCLSVQPSHLFKQRSFHLRLCASWAFFPGTFSVILGPDGEGHRSASFVQAPLWKEAALPNVISSTGRVHFGLWKKTIGSGHVQITETQSSSRPCPLWPRPWHGGSSALISGGWICWFDLKRAKGHPSPTLFTLHLAAVDTSFRKSHRVVSWGYHDLSRHRYWLPWCCQGDIMNFDLKCSWLAATLSNQERHLQSPICF